MKTAASKDNMLLHKIRIPLMAAIAAVLAGVMMMLVAGPVLAQVAEAPAADLGTLQAQADEIRSQIGTLNRDLEIVVEQRNATQVEFERLTQQLADSRAQLDFLLAEQHAQEELINNRLVTVYKNGDANILNLVMNSSSIDDFLYQTVYIMRVNEEDMKVEKQFRERARVIAEVTDQIDADRARQRQLEQDLADQKTVIETKIAERQATLDRVDTQVRQILDAEAARKRAEQERLAIQHESLLAELNISTDLQRQVVLTALQYLGVPYVWGGESPSGFDCSGLTKYVFAQFGVDLPHFAASQFNMGTPVDLNDLQPGDLLFWGPGYPHHVALYIGGNKYIEAPNFDEVVCVSDLVIDGDYAGARRYPLQPKS